MVGTCPEEYNKVSTITRKVKRQSTKIPVPCPETDIKNYNSRMGGVDLLDQSNCLQIGMQVIWWALLRQIIFLFMDISVVNSRAIYKGLYPKGMELLELKLVLAKSLIGLYNSRSRNTLVRHVYRREVLPASVQLNLQVLQKTRRKCRHCYTGGI